MARRLLSGRSSAIAALALVLTACQHGKRAPAPAASGSGSGSGSAERAFTEDTRAAHFTAERQRADQRWKDKPDLKSCASALHGDGDAELCSAAANALSAIERLEPDAAPERRLPVLAEASLTLARLSERARYQSLVDIGQKRITGDAGAPLRATPTTKPAASKPSPFGQRAPRDQQHALELEDSPSAQFLPVALRLERDALRDLAAYLEYAPLGVRQSAFVTVKQLRETHPRWPLLDHLIREAALLESDPDLKHALTELSASGLSRGKSDAQPASSK